MSDRHALYNMPRAEGEPPRWIATVYYRTDAGLVDVEHSFEEIDMLHDIIERGPDFHTLDRIEVRLAKNPRPGLTIEGALAS